MTAFHSTAEYGTAEAPRIGISMSCAPAGFTVAGTVAQVARAVGAAAFSLVGIVAVGAGLLTAAPSAYTLSGKALAVQVSAPLTVATFTLNGRAADMAWPTPAAAFILTGQGGVAVVSGVSSPAAIALAGKTIQAAMAAPPLSFALTGQDSLGVSMPSLDGRAFAIYGAPVFQIWKIGLDIPGEPATAEYGTAEFPRFKTFGIGAGFGSFAFAAQSALLTSSPERAAFILTPGRAEAAMAVAPSSFALSGQTVLTAIGATGGRAQFVLAAQTFASLLPLDPTAFVLTGRDALLRTSLDRALFALTGQAAAEVKWLGVSPAPFVVTGKPSLINIGFPLSRASFNLLGWQVSDITGPSGSHIYLVEVQAHDGTQLRTFYLSTEGFTSQPSDSPPNQFYDPRIIDPGNFERSLFDGSALRGRSKSNSGDIVIASSNPGNGLVLDDWFTYGWSRRDIRIRSLPSGAKSISAASNLFTGKLDRISSTSPLDKLSLKIGDRLSELEQPLLTELYAGTTLSSSATAEGNADLKGKIKQRCWGQCSNVPLQPVNPFDLIYLASNSAVSSIAVFDGGAALAYDGDSASLSALRAATIAGGHYRTCLAAGLIRIGALPDKSLTADVVEGATAAARTAGQIAYRMLLTYGIPNNTISTGSVSALDTANNAECCYFVDNDRTAISAVQDVLDSIGATMGADRDGTLVFSRLVAPSTTPNATFDLNSVAIGASLDMVDSDLPSWRILIEHAPNFTVQGDNDLLAVGGAVTDARRSFAAKEFRTITAENAAVKVKHLDAGEITIRTYFVDPAAAAAEAARQLALLGVERQRYGITMPLQDAWPSVPGDSITLRHPRLGLSGGGKPFVVLRRVDEYADDKIQFSLWG